MIIRHFKLTKLFEFATSIHHFLFDGWFLDKIDDMAMCLPFGPILNKTFCGIQPECTALNFHEE